MRSWRAMIGRTPPRSMPCGARTTRRRSAGSRSRACGSGSRGNIASTACRRNRDALAAGADRLEAAGARTGRGIAAPHQIRAAGLLHRGAGGGLIPISPAMTACATAARARAARSGRMYENTRARASAPKCSGACHGRDLRVWAPATTMRITLRAQKVRSADRAGLRGVFRAGSMRS